MLTAYAACLILGGGLVLFSLFGGDAEADGAAELDIDPDGANAAGPAAIFSIRALIYTLFAFGLSGTAMHLAFGGARTLLTALAASGAGLASGFSVHYLFGLLRRTEAGELSTEQDYEGLPGTVLLPVEKDSPGSVAVQFGDQQLRLRACLWDEDGPPILRGGQAVVVEMRQGVALISTLEEPQPALEAGDPRPSLGSPPANGSVSLE